MAYEEGCLLDLNGKTREEQRVLQELTGLRENRSWMDRRTNQKEREASREGGKQRENTGRIEGERQ